MSPGTGLQHFDSFTKQLSIPFTTTPAFEGFILIDNLGYKVEEERLGYYAATKIVDEFGNVSYWAPQGGKLTGTTVAYKVSNVYNSEATISALINLGYINTAHLALRQ